MGQDMISSKRGAIVLVKHSNSNDKTMEKPLSEEEIQINIGNNNGIKTRCTCVGVPERLLKRISVNEDGEVIDFYEPPESVTAYHYIEKLGFFASTYNIDRVDGDTDENPRYKFYGSTDGSFPEYENLMNFKLTEKEVVEDQLLRQRKEVSDLESALEIAKIQLSKLQKHKNGEKVLFHITNMV
jgi:hypothetical protein